MTMKIGPHIASGIDKISARLLRIAAPVIAPSVAKLINLSFSTCKFPTRWKTAKLTPLFKSGARYDPGNYRPISVLPVCQRLLNVKCIIVFIPFSMTIIWSTLDNLGSENSTVLRRLLLKLSMIFYSVWTMTRCLVWCLWITLTLAWVAGGISRASAFVL